MNQTAISKLPLVADYEEAASYSTRLDAAISRVSTLPTAEEWQMMEEKKAAEEAAAQEAVQQQISQEQSKLEGALNQEQKKWNNSTPHEVGPGVSPSPVVIPGPEGE